jgi:hypothetical protein
LRPDQTNGPIKIVIFAVYIANNLNDQIVGISILPKTHACVTKKKKKKEEEEEEEACIYQIGWVQLCEGLGSSSQSFLAFGVRRPTESTHQVSLFIEVFLEEM